jgi:hypothetical protein
MNQQREPKRAKISPQQRICGCQAYCKGLQKLVSLSTFNRHRKHRNEESFSNEFRGFLASSSAGINHNPQREATFRDIPESEAELPAYQVHNTETDRSPMDGNEEGEIEEGDLGTGIEDSHEETQPMNSTSVRLDVSVSGGWNYSPVTF